jgi:hypothetical protein
MMGGSSLCSGEHARRLNAELDHFTIEIVPDPLLVTVASST